MSFSSFPVDVVGLILRPTFVGNDKFQSMKLELVCKSFKEAMDKYYDKCTIVGFVCKGCNRENFTWKKVLKCENCPYTEFSHDNNCKTKRMRKGGYKTEFVKKCKECGGLEDKHEKNCKNGVKKIRGIQGFCPYCLCNLKVKECRKCSFEFMSTLSSNFLHCISCMPTQNLKCRNILPTDEPFCY
jgi:hypothetical protein